MISRLFHAIDDFLIDCVFQPVCDTFRKLFGWTKSALMGISLVVTIICYIPMCAMSINEKIIPEAGWMMAAWIIYCSWLAIRLIQKGTSGEDDLRAGSNTMDAARVELFVPRIVLSLTTAATIPIFIQLVQVVPAISFIASTFLVGVIFAISALYFHACTDLPPGKTILAKAKEWLAEHFAKPIVTLG